MSIPIVNALLFSLAGAFFIAFYVIHRIRVRNDEREARKAFEKTFCSGVFKPAKKVDV